MATFSRNAGNLYLTSTWTVTYGLDGYKISSGPSIDTKTVTFDLSSIPDGATITNVEIRAGLNSPSTGATLRQIGMDGDPNWWNFNGYTTYLGTLKSLFDSGVRSVSVWFRFKANGYAAPPTGQQSSKLTVSDITLTVTYTPPAASYTPCGAPTTISLSASVSDGDATVTFSGATGSTNNAITGYVVEYAESANGTAWGSWGGRKTINSTSGSGSFPVSPPSTRGYYRKFRVYTLGTAGADYGSAWKEIPGTLRKNSLPAAPGITAPAAGAKTYNPTPRLLVTVGSDADGHKQAVSCAGYAPSSTGQQDPGKKLVLRRSSALSAGAQSISVASTDALGAAGSAASRSFTYAVPSWTDASLVAGQTPIKAAHINDLRTAINAIRAYYGMAAYSWAQVVTAGATSLAGWTAHVTELRTAIDQVVALVNGWDSANTTHDISLPAWIPITQNKPTAAVMQQLRDAIPLL